MPSNGHHKRYSRQPLVIMTAALIVPWLYLNYTSAEAIKKTKENERSRIQTKRRTSIEALYT